MNSKLKQNGLMVLILMMGISFFSCDSESKEVPLQKGARTLVWNDEFDYEGEPDQEKWSYDTGKHAGWGNAERQNYTMERTNSFVEKGLLHIVARKDMGQWTSARLKTYKKQTWTYGRFEIRAKLPEGVGTWPAIWMLPKVEKYGGWPRSGEIDIMEHVGFQQNIVHGTVHTFAYNHNKGTQKGHYEEAKNVSRKWHVYALEWEENQIRTYVDDKLYLTFDNEGERDKWPFDHPFYLIMNIAIGGGWGGREGIAKDMTDAEMLIDYVRVYQ